ncbi:MAG: hypothetical protein PHY93_14370 [Bacteriovorax sp.]|nr:hypothetical protein [Bacteriovorax sp.]
MRQITLINACFFLYVLLAGRPLAEHDETRGFLAINSTKLDQVFSCVKNKSCSKTSYQSTAKFKHVDIILVALGSTNISFLSYTVSFLRSLQLQTFRLPIYRYLKTGLSPPHLT